jgi:hypothetical protein
MRRSPLVVVTSLAVFAAACSAAPEGAPSAASQNADLSADTATTYVAIADFWKTSTDQTAWSAAVANLKLQFDDICGDTFCDGDYGNIESLELNCGVSSVRGQVKTCTWVFAASNATVSATTGDVTTSAPHYLCTFAPKMTAKALSAALVATNSFQGTTLPGMTETLYDAVGECLQNPIAANTTATPNATASATGYEDPADADNIDEGAWDDMASGLSSSFADVCGDTFCEGDYPNLTAFLFTCGVNTKSTKIQECRWVFQGSNSTVAAATGAVTVNEKSWVCPITAHGTAANLISTLTSASSVEPVQRTLPGETTSAYDALAKCLK